MLDYNWRRHRRVVDIGGAYGSFLARILRQHTKAAGVLFDQPQVLPPLRCLGAHACTSVSSQELSGTPRHGFRRAVCHGFRRADWVTAPSALSDQLRPVSHVWGSLSAPSAPRQGCRRAGRRVADISFHVWQRLCALLAPDKASGVLFDPAASEAALVNVEVKGIRCIEEWLTTGEARVST